MHFLIADSFTASLGKLTGEEQKAVKTTAFDLQLNPANPGFSFHKLDRAKDKNFWSVRVSRDIRIIVHRTDESLLLCYVDHHDKAYHWAERRKLETHPTTGAAQIVEIRERIEEIIVPVYVDAPAKRSPRLFERYSDDELLGWGVPQEWLADVRAADEDSLLVLADHLPAEAAEALLELATGGKPVRLAYGVSGSDPFTHPDAQRRFRLMTDVEELRAALDYPWEKWTLFLHPAQRQVVERDYNGPTRISGSAGTGKTIVALHRVNHLLRKKDDIIVLLATFSEPLANALNEKLNRLLRDDPRLRERVQIKSLDALGMHLYNRNIGNLNLLDEAVLRKIMQDAAAQVTAHKFSHAFLLAEWRDIVDSNNITSLEGYRDAKRLGRKTRLSDAQRQTVWQIFQRVQEILADKQLVSVAGVFNRLTDHFNQSSRLPYDYIVVDEAQDISIPQLRFLAALGRDRPDALFFTGDIGQRIFQTAFSWKALGVDIRGRSRTLNINYRTSHQIRQLADQLLAPEVSDADSNSEQRDNTISVFNGPSPQIITCKSEAQEIETISKWLIDNKAQGYLPQEIGIFVRSDEQIKRARAAAEKAKLSYIVLDHKLMLQEEKLSIATMHLVKGLEFRAVAVMACDQDVLPSSERIASISDESDLVEVQETERHLFYVACTRARDNLIVTSGGTASEFLEDLLSTVGRASGK